MRSSSKKTGVVDVEMALIRAITLAAKLIGYTKAQPKRLDGLAPSDFAEIAHDNIKSQKTLYAAGRFETVLLRQVCKEVRAARARAGVLMM